MKFPLHSLEDVEVTRVDLVKRASTGRKFLIMKDRDHQIALDQKLARLKSLGHEPNQSFYDLAKSGSIDPFAVLNSEIARLQKVAVSKSADSRLGTGVFADVIWPIAKRKDKDGDGDGDDMNDAERTRRGVAATKAAHPFHLYTQDKNGEPVLHSTHPNRTAAMGKAHSMLESGECKRVAVEDVRDAAYDESKSLKSIIERFKMQKGYGRDAFLSGSISAERAFDIDSGFGRDFDADGGKEWSGPADEDVDLQEASTGSDALSRAYAEDVHQRLAGPMSRRLGGDPDDRIPAAGAGGSTVVGDTRNVDYKPQAFAANEGDMVGGEDRGGTLGGPRPAGYGLLKEGDEPDTVAAVRVGPNYLMPSEYTSHGPSGAKFPDADLSLLKIHKSSKIGRGVFRDVIRGPEAGQSTA
jgi:hypothetical protein